MNILSKPATVLTAREFNQDTARAKRAAKHGPVFITDRGKPSHVLLSIEEYERLEEREETAGTPQQSLRQALIDPIHGDEFDLIIPERRIEPPRPIELY